MKKYIFFVIGIVLGILLLLLLTGGHIPRVAAQTTACNPVNSDKPYRNTGTDFLHDACTEGRTNSCSDSCPGSAGGCYDGKDTPGHKSSVPYRCGYKRNGKNAYILHGNEYTTSCGKAEWPGTTSSGSSSCTYSVSVSDGNGGTKTESRTGTTYSCTACKYTSYYGDDYNSSNERQDDWEDDVGTQFGCKVPASNSSCFDNSPQARNGQTNKYNEPKVAAGYETGGCGNGNDIGGSGAGGSPNGCWEQICNDSSDNHAQKSCRKARDGNFKCGGTAGCGENVCENDYLSPGYWGTGTGGGFTTTGYALSKQKYEICNLNTEKHADAIEVCKLENTTIEVTHKGAKAALACRCGQRDVCDLTTAENNDLMGKPATLKIVKLELENMVLTRSAPPSLPNSGHVNTLDRHRMKVQFDLADCYNNGSCSNNTPANQAKDILYTRLIEVCPVNLSANSWTLQTDNWCVIRRVDGNLVEIQKEFVIDFPGFAISQNSEGPWTIRYRAINDVCNRTIYDNTLKTTGASKNCTGGESCLKVGKYDCYDGTFGGIQQVGNDPNGSGTYIKVNYCASNAATNLDSAINPATYSNSRSKLYLDLLYTPKN